MGATRSTKYLASMEKVAEVLEQYASFPTLELEKLFKLTLFSFLIGNEDLHLKNFSIQTTTKGVSKLTPLYDVLNSTIALPEAQEELALELNGTKRKLTKADFIDYFAPEHCYVPKTKAIKILYELLDLIPIFEIWIRKSFLTKHMQDKYLDVLRERTERLS